MSSSPATSNDIPPPLDRRSLNLPNLITTSRFLLAIWLFFLIDLPGWRRTAAVVFAFAAATDFFDGYLARKYGQVTTLGRILDPFVDKIIIGGAFIFLHKWKDSGVTSWLVFVVIAREMFITSLRAIMEERGVDFSAQWSGKLKMAAQCLAVPFCILSLSNEFRPTWELYSTWDIFIWLRDMTIWAALAITLYSGIEYTIRAFRLLGKANKSTAV